MGCCQSNKIQAGPRKVSIRKKDKEIVRTTWAIISEQKEKFGVFVYNNFLSQEKELRRLFPRLVVLEGQEKFKMNEEQVRRHALLVMDGLGLAVERVNDEVKLRHVLSRFGASHFKAGVKQDMLPKLYPAIDEGLRMLLADEYTRKTRRAWREFFFFLVDGMTATMVPANSPPKDAHG